MERPTPSPTSRQLIVAVVIALLGVLSIGYGHRYDLALSSYLPLEVLAILLIACGILIRILALKEIRNTRHIEKLVTTGIYSKTRNPVYLAFSIIIAGIVLLYLSLFAFIWGLISASILLWMAKREETDLQKAFGDLFLNYKRNVPAFFPRFRKQKNTE
jgi:protein-S-isoprenylcysteine O-methyltransferase Ste14